MKKHRLLLIMLLAVCTAPLWAQDAPQAIAQYQGATLSKKNGVYIINVAGSFEQMGEQYGYLLSPQLHSFYQTYHHQLKLNTLLTKFILWLRESRLPQSEKDFLKGMAKTSGLQTYQLMMLDHSVQMIYVAREADKIGLGCSIACVSGAYTKNGEMIVARNFDWLKDFRSIMTPYLTVAIFHPTQGNAFATLSYVGASLSAVTAMNDKGLYIELNSAISSVGPYIRFMRPSYFAQMMQMMQSSNDFEALRHAVLTTPPDESYTITIASPTQSSSIEMSSSPFLKNFTKERTGLTHTVYANDIPHPGLVISTNSFRSIGWKNTWFAEAYPKISTTQSFERYDQLQAWATRFKGSITPALARQILTTPVNLGGVAQTAGTTISSNDYYTYYSSVALPGQLQWQIYATDMNSSWTIINLGPYFKNVGSA